MTTSMRTIVLLGMALLLPLASADARTKVRDADTATAVLENIAIHGICGNGNIAGIETVFTAKVPRLGRSAVRVSASWDWGNYSADHPAALVNLSSQPLGDILNACNAFTANATVRLIKLSGAGLTPAAGDITAEITGGSVYEVVVAPDPRVTAAAHGGTCPAIGFPTVDGTINESITNFEADPSQPDNPSGSISGVRWASRVGRITGTIRTRLNSCTGESESFIATNVEKP